MSTASLPCGAIADAHRDFLAALPAMDNAIRFHLRRVPRRFRAEAICDAHAAAWHAWYGLLRRGKDPLAVGPTGLARNAVRYVLADRRLGTGTAGRHADIYSRKARQNMAVALISLDRPNGSGASANDDWWADWIAQDRRYGPADEAAFRIDFAAWLAGLSLRKRQMAELLAAGHETCTVAAALGVTPAAVSITRNYLRESRQAFRGDAGAAEPLPRRSAETRPGKADRRESRAALAAS